MSELKGMRCYVIAETNEDGSFYIKKSTSDGSLGVFDERHSADRSAAEHPHDVSIEPIYIVRESRFIEVKSNHDKLTEQNEALTKTVDAYMVKLSEQHEEIERLRGDIKFLLEVSEAELITDDARERMQKLIESK